MAQRNLWVPQPTIDFAANSRKSSKLTRGGVMREIYLRLTGAPTLTAANNTAAKTLRGDEWALLKNLRLTANGSDVLREYSEADLLWYTNAFFYKAFPKINPLIADATTANVAFDSTLILPIWRPNSARPMDSAFPSGEVADLSIDVDWGTFTDFNASATAFTTTPSLQIVSHESVGYDGARGFDVDRNFILKQDVAAANSKTKIQIPPGGDYFGFIVNARSAGVDTAGLISNFKVNMGNTTVFDMPEPIVQATQAIRSGLGFNQAQSSTGVLKRSSVSDFDGWYYLNPASDGYGTEHWGTNGLSTFELELNVTAACTIVVSALHSEKWKP